MAPVKSFPVLGDKIDLLIPQEMTGGHSATFFQISPPGGGPPPHRHENEDETFFIVEGQYEILIDGEWVNGAQGDCFYRQRGTVHTFRNCGTTDGRMLIFVQPGAFQKYLEAISPLNLPADFPKLLEISAEYGLSFPGLPLD